MDWLDGVLAVILNITYILLRIDKDTRAGKQEDFISISLFSHFALIYCFQVRRSCFFFQLLSLSNDSPQTGNSKCAQQSLKCTQLRRDVIWRCQGNCETFVDMKKSILTCAVKLIFLKRWKKSLGVLHCYVPREGNKQAALHAKDCDCDHLNC